MNTVRRLTVVIFFLLLSAHLAAMVSPADTLINEVYLTDSVSIIKPMGLFDLSIGTAFHSAKAVSETDPSAFSSNFGWGISGRMQNSILWNYRAARPQKRFAWGDILSAEVFAGRLHTGMQHESGGVWTAYKFEFGFSGVYRINKNTEAGLHLILLTFSRDNIAGNISGSAITGRLRYCRVMAEAGLIARHERVLGVFTDLSGNIAMMESLTLRYLLPGGKNIGITGELLSGTYHQEGVAYPRIGTVKLFYGIYF